MFDTFLILEKQLSDGFPDGIGDGYTTIVGTMDVLVGTSTRFSGHHFSAYACIEKYRLATHARAETAISRTKLRMERVATTDCEVQG